MIITVYGYPIYKAQVDNNTKILEEVQINMKNIGNKSAWDSECLTTSSFDDENRFISEYVKLEVIRHATKMMEHIGSDIQLTTKMCDSENCILCDDIWMNVYNKGHYQVTHAHYSEQPGADIPIVSFSYFARYKHGEDAQFIFVNPVSSQPKEIAMDVNQGDILIFPSFMLHRVDKQNTDGPRITISGNLYHVLKD